ncbi:MAG: glutathione peroxidase [Pseudomonadota bacterium]
MRTSICAALSAILLSGCGAGPETDTPDPAQDARLASPATDAGVEPTTPPVPDTAPEHEKAASAMLYDLDFTTITGDPLPFSTLEGKAVLIVNTASRCGFTRQYEGLQALWTGYKDEGLVVLGVPSNDFGGQEPGTEAEVKTFCEINYGVDFPLTAKTRVVGTDRHPVYAGLEDALGEAARPKWNFHKILVGKDGTPLQAFPSSVEPDAPELVAAIETALAG